MYHIGRAAAKVLSVADLCNQYQYMYLSRGQYVKLDGDTELE